MPFVDPGDISRRMGQDKFIQCTDDDNDGKADPNVVQEICDDVDAVVRSILVGKGYGADGLRKLEEDKGLRRLASWIGADFTCDRRQEFKKDDGTNDYTQRAKDARADIAKYAAGELRSGAEDQAGKSANLKSASTSGTPRYYFRSDPRDPDGRNQGGF